MKVAVTFVNLFFMAGAILLLIFTVLSGSSKHAPLNKFYWLQADTSDIPNAPANRSAWTFWGVCDKNDFSNCLLGPAYPIDPQDNFGTTENVPEDFLNNENTFYYLSRFSFAFCLIALAFVGLAFIIDILGLCFEIIDKVVIILITIALIFMAGFAAMQTGVTVLAKNAFRNADRYAHVGAKSMGIMWAAFVCILICWVLTFSANIANSYRKHMNRVKAEKQAANGGVPILGPNDGDESSFTRVNPPSADIKDEDHTGGIRFFKIKRNHKVSDEDSV
ncbi:hypothetical protein CTRG_02860 [Candida tropicalis MYA-3404]|uniref:Protein SUR7 n=1 Tax=Candida tropicalis (strain ATCC MYA-3404 / T1) TaxID=294747 RepID=C5M8Y8_CANTT|nr:hypothetical protein CTRG_02860 [Candida tropicalis MYA-3404]EER34042.1 hypothetical protein CTRG_02860 [Candida tropicalis MYA-3404]KAG4407902.1 hypothetical protein JTP64_003438 [Candida tropicalis]